MAWTAPVSRATGYLVLASDWNNEHVGDLQYLHGDAGAMKYASGATPGSPYSAGLVVGGDGTHPSWSIVDSGHEAFISCPLASNYAAFLTTLNGDSGGWRFQISGDGTLYWGPGTGAFDAQIGKAGASMLNVSGISGPLSAASLGVSSYLAVPYNIGFGAGGNAGVYIDSGGRLQSTSGANINALAASITGDSQFRFTLQSQTGAISWGPGGSTAPDVQLGRGGGGIISVGSAIYSGAGNAFLGLKAVSQGGGTTYTPDGSYMVHRVNVTSTGVLTLAAPTTPPPTAQSALMVLIVHNASGGTITYSWNAAYSPTPSSTGPVNGTGATFLLAWSGATSKWEVLLQNTE